MKLNKNRILEYLKNHVGENTTTYLVIKESGAFEEDWNKLDIIDQFRLDKKVRDIAENSSFILDDVHHWGMPIGMSWNIDFYIEEYDRNKVISEIMNEQLITKRILMVQNEFGIYDDKTGEMIGLKEETPEEIRKIYSEDYDWLDKKQEEGFDVD